MARAPRTPKPEAGMPDEQPLAESVDARLESPHDAPDAAAHPRVAEAAELVPGWLALLVLVLLLGVAGLGGFLVRGALTKTEATTPEQYAVDSLEKEIKDDPSNIDNQLSLGYAYQQEGRYEDALAQYDAVLAQNAANAGALYNKGVVLMALGRNKEGETVLWDLLKIAPDHVLAAKALGDYYVGNKHFKSALVALEPVIELQPQYADLQYLAGYSCEQLGRTADAVAYYQAALSYNPDMTEAKEGLARVGQP